MKYIASLLLAVSLLFAGCSTPNKSEQTALTVAKVEVNSVTGAMAAFVKYEQQYGASAQMRANVDSAYQKVRLANLAAEGLWVAYKKAVAENAANTPSILAAYQNALQAVAESSAELIAFVVVITSKH